MNGMHIWLVALKVEFSTFVAAGFNHAVASQLAAPVALQH